MFPLLLCAVCAIPRTDGLGQTAEGRATTATVTYKAESGRVKRQASTGEMVIESEGRKVVVVFKQVDRITYTKVAPDGAITVEDVVEESEVSVDGEPIAGGAESPKETDTTVFRPNGEIVSFGSTDKDGAAVRQAARLFPSTHIVFPPKPVGVGDVWSHRFAGDESQGFRSARLDVSVVALEDRGNVACLKLKTSYVETAGPAPLRVSGVVWVERSTGDRVESELEVANLPLGEDSSLVTGTVKERRESGGPMAPHGQNGSVNPTAKPVGKRIDDVVKDHRRLPGVVTLWHRNEPGGRETLFAEIPEKDFGKPMLLQATASTGTTDQIEAGEPIEDLVFQWTRAGEDRVHLSVPNWSRVAPAGSPTERAVRRSFPEAWLQTYKIEATQPERGSVLVDVTDLFRGDLMRISQAFGLPLLPGMPMAPGGPMSLDRERTSIESIRNFPENLVVTTRYHFLRGAPRPIQGTALADGRSAPLTVVFNVSRLPIGNGYRPRLADPRVGFFTNEPYGLPVTTDFGKEDRRDPKVRYIHRFDLRKRDVKAARSEPAAPIVFWLDHAIPEEHRSAIREGLLVWNTALEGAGFKSAIQVRQMPDHPDPEDASVPADTADGRFNVVRWVAATDGETAHAVAHARFNPLTGQILGAGITITSSFVRFTRLEKRDIVDPSSVLERVASSKTEPAAIETSVLKCTFATGRREAAWFGWEAVRAAQSGVSLISEKEYVAQFLKETVAHEMGHILGLRHNFAGSAQRTAAQLRDPVVARSIGTTASLMDYTPFNPFALGRHDVPWFSPVVGEYDRWAIQYGYTPLEGVADSDGERPFLARIARRSGEPGLAYQTDEAADGIDPAITRYDLGSDPLGYWERSLATSRRLIATLDRRSPSVGESYWDFTRRLMQLLNTIALAGGHVSRHIGGVSLGRSHRGDAAAKPVFRPLSGDTQRRALAILDKSLFAPGAVALPARYAGLLTVDPEAFPSQPGEFPIQDWMANLGRSALRRILSGPVLSRVANNAAKAAKGERPFGLPELFGSLDVLLWKEVATGGPVDHQRRQLQRQHVDLLVEMVVRGGVPEDARMLAWESVEGLRARLRRAKTRDRLARIHWADLAARLGRAFDARSTSGGMTAQQLLQALSGAKAADVRR